MERKYGENKGLTKDERKKLKETNLEINDIWNYNKNIDFNGIETMNDFCSRVYKFLDDIVEKYREKNTLSYSWRSVCAYKMLFYEISFRES